MVPLKQPHLICLPVCSSPAGTVPGVNVKQSFRIGYCPQFDALPGKMSGREVLRLLSRLNGFRNVADRVAKTLWAIKMEAIADKTDQTVQTSWAGRSGGDQGYEEGRKRWSNNIG